MGLSLQVGALNKGNVDESAASFTLGAYRGVTDNGQQANGRLDPDASHPQTDAAVPHTADGAGSAVPSEPAVATAVDLADSDCSKEAALDQTSAHSSGSPGSAGTDGLLPLSSDSDCPTAAASSSNARAAQHVSTAEARSASEPSSDASSAGAAHASTGSDQLAAREAVSSGQAATAVAELTDSGRRTSAAQTTSSAASMFAPRAGTALSSPSGSFVAAMGDAQSEPSSPTGSLGGIGGAQSGPLSPPSSSMGKSGILSGPKGSSSSSSTAPTAAHTQLDDSTSMLCQAEDKPESAAAAATAAKSVIGHISSSAMPSQTTTPAEDDVSSLTAAAGKGTGAARASEAGSKSMASDIFQGGVVDSPAQSPNSPPCHAWQDAQLQSATHATNADTAAPVSGADAEDTVQRSGSSEATGVQSVVGSQQQASRSEQQQDSSSVIHEGGVESIASAQQSVEQQDTPSRAALEEEAQPATAPAAPVQPHQSVQQSAAEEEEQVPDAAAAREQQASSTTSKDEDYGDAAQRQISEEEQQQQIPGRFSGHDAHDHVSADVEDCKVPTNPRRQVEERMALLTQTTVEGQTSSSPDSVKEEDEQGPAQLATEEDKQKIASSSPVREEEEQGMASSSTVREEEEQDLHQSAAQQDKQQSPPSSPLSEEDEQAFSQSASGAAEEGQGSTDLSHDAEQSADTSVPLLPSPSSPVSEEEAAQQLQTSNAYDARLPASDTSFRADSSSQRKAKPGFLAKALFCSVAWPVLVPIVAFSSCIQLYDACSMTEVLRYTV